MHGTSKDAELNEEGGSIFEDVPILLSKVLTSIDVLVPSILQLCVEGLGKVASTEHQRGTCRVYEHPDNRGCHLAE